MNIPKFSEIEKLFKVDFADFPETYYVVAKDIMEVVEKLKKEGIGIEGGLNKFIKEIKYITCCVIN